MIVTVVGVDDNLFFDGRLLLTLALRHGFVRRIRLGLLYRLRDLLWLLLRRLGRLQRGRLLRRDRRLNGLRLLLRLLLLLLLRLIGLEFLLVLLRVLLRLLLVVLALVLLEH